MNTSVLILTGPPGAGKTTTARAMTAAAGRSVHLESDAFFRSIRSGFIEPWRPESHAQNEIVMQSVGAAARRYAAGGYFTVVDGIVLPKWFLRPLREGFQAAGLPAAYAVLRPPLQTCLTRTRARNDTTLADPGVVERLWRQFADLGELEPHAVEVTAHTTGQIVERITERLRDGSLSL